MSWSMSTQPTVVTEAVTPWTVATAVAAAGTFSAAISLVRPNTATANAAAITSTILVRGRRILKPTSFGCMDTRIISAGRCREARPGHLRSAHARSPRILHDRDHGRYGQIHLGT